MTSDESGKGGRLDGPWWTSGTNVLRRRELLERGMFATQKAETHLGKSANLEELRSCR